MAKIARKPVGAVMGAALAAVMMQTPAAHAASDNPFASAELQSGYQLASAADQEGKCGEGKCGAMGDDAQKTAQEGKCGEGKCGEDMPKKHKKTGEGKCGGDMEKVVGKTDQEGKCGEGKCGEGKCGSKSQ